MISEELQFQIHKGDREAFRALYTQNAKRIYLAAVRELGEDAPAREITKHTFLQLQKELSEATGPMDADQRLNEILAAAIETAKGQKAEADAVAEATEACIRQQTAPRREEAPVSPQDAPPPAVSTPPQGTLPTVLVQLVSPLPQPEPQPIPESPAPPVTPRETDEAERTMERMREEIQTALPPREYRKMRRSILQKTSEKFDEEPSKGGTWLITLLIVLFFLLFLWILAGILMDLGLIPFADLGYAWFNGNIFPLFRLQ